MKASILVRLPSVKMLEQFGWPNQIAVKIRKRLEEYRGYEFRGFSLDLSLDGCLDDISNIIGGFGHEYIARGHNKKSPAINYVNMGDTYATTILFIDGNFKVGNWGDIVERGRYD